MKRKSVIPIRLLLLLATLLTISIVGFLGARLWQLRWLPINGLEADISQPIERTQILAALNPETILNAGEISTLSSSPDSGGVVRMIQASEDGNLLAVYGSGAFRRWDLNTLHSLAEFDLLATGPKGVNFSSDGALVITPGALMTSSEINGYTVWDARIGTVVACEGPHCPEGWSHLDAVLAGIGLTPNARWIVDYSSSVIHATGVQLRISGSWDIDSGLSDTSDHTISRIAFDSTGFLIACATQEDEVWVLDMDNLFNPEGRTNDEIITGRSSESDSSSVEVVKHRRYGDYHPDANTNTADLAFDDTRTWLAQLTERDLVVWDLRKLIFPQRMNIPVESGTVLAFNHAGNLLAVGTNKGILIFDLESQKQITSFDVGEVTALYFSRDDRLLIWGDPDGAIHLWGVAQNP